MGKARKKKMRPLKGENKVKMLWCAETIYEPIGI